jgi:alpha-N-arabinofuranosidase
MKPNHCSRKNPIARLALLLALAGTLAIGAKAQTTNAPEATAPASNTIPVLQIKAGQVTAKVSPMLYGLMTEEINYAYEGGLYGELIRNRTFQANPTNAVFWSTIGGGAISLDTNQPFNDALNVSLKLDTSKASDKSPAGIANDGYWGIPVRPDTAYHASFYARGEHFSGALTVQLESADGQKVLACATVPKISGRWQKYEVVLTTGKVASSKENRLVISTADSGSFWHRHNAVWFQQVSLFPPTFNNRPNGNRPDLMQLMADMKPKFLRFPGGNYLEGNYIETRFNWKNTVGDVSRRPGHMNDAWGYWSTDGMGLLEFLNWCEDLRMEPLLAVYAGYALRHDYIKPGPDLEPFVQDALDEIEYVTGGINTAWGAQRARDGHPAPFPLHYVEVGNEDWFDRTGSYDRRFAQFYDAVKAKYPGLQVIATTKTKTREPDLIDEHFYRSQEEMEAHALDYDQRSRDGKTRVFVGEWATRVGSPTPNMAGALGDAAWMTGMERNSDLVIMSCYAPLFVNVSDTGKGHSMQWKTDLIGYDALTSYGSPAYYAQKMFSTHHGDVVLATGSQDIPTYTWQPPAKRRNGVEQPRPPAQQVATLFFDATRDSQNGTIYLKVVNRREVPQPVKIEISGLAAVAAEGEAVVLKANSPDDTNSIQEPAKIVPVVEKADGLGTSFTREFPPYSITILELKAR